MKASMGNLLGDGVFLLGGFALGTVLIGIFWFVYNVIDFVTVGIGLGFVFILSALYRSIRNHY